MLRLALFAGVVLLAPALADASQPKVDLTRIDRTIHREPSYRAEPRYALLVIGPQAEHRAWFVTDGDKVAYIDRNGNGDLTESDERIELDRDATDKIQVGGSPAYKAMHVFPLGNVAGAKLDFHLWVRNPAYDASKDETLRGHPEILAYIQELNDRHWWNGSLLRTAADGMQAQTPLALTTRPEDAQVCHLLGPLTFKLKSGEAQALEPWPKRTIFDVHIGTPNLPPRGWKRQGFDFSPLTTSEVPGELHPVATFEFPKTPSGGKPLHQEIVLKQRCCGDTFYEACTLPQGVTSGVAQVTLSFPLWLERSVQPARFQVPIRQDHAGRSEAAYVMFHDPQIQLKDAVNVLRKRKLDVTIVDGSAVVSQEGLRVISVRLNRAPEVREVARGLAGGENDSAEMLSRCDARFEIAPYNPNTAEMIERIEQWLQQATQGFVYQTWDQRRLPPM